jgi:hypothetical protein
MVDADDAGAKCQDCSWRGTRRDLIEVPLPKDPHSLDLREDRALHVAEQISRNLLLLLAQKASPVIGLCMIESGICGRKDVQSMKRLIKAACEGTHKAILDEADKISKEYQQRRIPS